MTVPDTPGHVQAAIARYALRRRRPARVARYRRPAAAVGAQRSSRASRPTVSPGRDGTDADRQQHARHERRPGRTSRAGWSASPRSCRAAPPGARPARPAGPSAPARRRRRRRGRPASAVVGRVRHRAEAGLGPGRGDQRRGRGPRCRSARRPCCGWCSSMISTDSKNRAARAANSHHQHRADGEVRRDRSRRPRAPASSQRRTGRQPLGVKPVVPTTHVDALVDAPAEVVHDHVRAW